MRIVKKGVSLPVVLLVFGLSACTTTVSQDPPVITPITYTLPSNSFERSIGRLRRLAIAPVRFWRVVGLFGCPYEDIDENTKKDLLFGTINFLNDWKGYEALPIDLHENLLQQKLELSREQVGQHIDMLADWAVESDPRSWLNRTHVTSILLDIIPCTRKGEQRPTDMVSAVSAIGHALHVDGLVFIHGLKPGALNLFSELWLRADIYEVSSGRIVWTKERILRVPIANAADIFFESLEDAIPKVLVNEK